MSFTIAVVLYLLGMVPAYAAEPTEGLSFWQTAVRLAIWPLVAVTTLFSSWE